METTESNPTPVSGFIDKLTSLLEDLQYEKKKINNTFDELENRASEIIDELQQVEETWQNESNISDMIDSVVV